MYNHSVIIINSSYKKSIMKSYLSKLSVLLLGAMFAVVGCQDYDEDIRKINDQLSANVTDLNSIIDELEDEIAELEKLAATHATKEELDALKTQLQGDLANVKKALEDAYKAADAELNTKIEAAKQAAQDALDQKAQVLEGQIDGVKKDVAAVYTYIETELIPLVNKAINDAVSASAETLRGEIAKAVTDLTAKDNALQASLNEAIGRIDKNAADILALQADLKTASDAVKKAQEDILKNAADIEAEKLAREQAVAALKAAYEAKVAQLEADLLANVAALNAEKAAREAADAALRAEYTAADAALRAALEKTINSNASAIAALQTKVAALESKVAELQTKVAQVLAKVEANEAAITDLGKQIDALEESVLKTLENLENKVEDLATALRSVVVVPETMYNGTKAVKFHRVEGENVLKTFAYVSFHFNPGNFDVESADYEVMAENVEFMTRAAAPAIEIVGKPVKEGDKVTFLFERAEGAGNMFALKATLADGSVVYSEYVAILDEATFVTANAVASVDVARLSFLFPSINSLSDLIETIKSLGTVAEDFEAYVASVKAAIEAVQNNDYISAMQNLAKFPFFSTATETIYGYGSHTVQVETFDAEQFFEELMNAQSVSEITNILSSLIGKAEGLGGAVGDSIVQGIQNALGATDGLAGLLGQYGDLTGKLPELENSVSTATAYLQQMLDNITPDLTPLKETLAQQQAELAAKQAELDAMISGLDAETKAQVLALYEEHAVLEAQYNATQAELNAAEAEYEAMSLKDKFSSAGVKLAARIAELGATATYQSGLVTAKEAEITAKVGTTEFFTKMAEIAAVKVKIGTTESSISTLESVIKGAQGALDNAQGNLDSVKDKLADLEQKILDAAKNRLEDTELGQYIKQLENALAEEGWNARKTIAEADAKIWASDAALADLIKNYEAANEQVVEEFKESILGRVAYLIKTDEAAKAFETLGLSEVHAALKLVPDLLTVVLKYYPTSISDLQGVIPQITEVTWETDYLLVDYVPAE